MSAGARAWLVFVVFALAWSAAWSQSGGLRIVVVDATDNSPLPGATVTLTSDVQLVPETSILTDSQGRAVFPVLRPGGGYSVEVAMAGFATKRLGDLRVKFSVTSEIAVAMTEEFTETVEVRATTGAVDLEDLRGATRFGDDFIQDLPVQGRLYTNVLVLAPGVQDSDGDGNPNVHGARERDFQAIVGGVSNVDPLTGLRLSELNIDSIEEIEVVTMGAGVEYGRAQGGFANIIEKQGTNRFEGLFNFIYRSSALDGNGATGVSDERIPNFDWIQPAIQLSGPIVKDTAWYRVSSELIDRQDPIDTLGGVATIDTTRWNNSAMITWQVSRRNRLAFSYLDAPLRIENVGVDSTTPVDSTSVFEFEGPTWRVGWTAPYSSRLLVESLVAYQDAGQNILPTTVGKENSCVGSALEIIKRSRCVDTILGLTSGSFPTTWKDKRQRLTVRTQVNLYNGRFWGSDHHFKFGFAVENERYQRYLERGGEISLFEFSQLSRDLGVVSGRFAVPPESEARAVGTNVALFVEDQLRPMPNLTVTVGLRVDHETINSEGREPFDPATEAAKLFDTVEPLYMAGADPEDVAPVVRSTMPHTFTAYEDVDDFVYQLASLLGISEQDAFTRLQSYATQSVAWDQRRRPEDISITNTNPAPFLGVAWDPFKTGKTKISVTVGRHYDKIFLAVPLIELEPVTTDLSFQARLIAGEWVVFDECAQGACFNPAANTRVVDRDLRTPYQDEFTLGFEREIAPETALRIVYVHRDFEDQLQDIDINHATADLGQCAQILGVAQVRASPGEGQELWDPWAGRAYIDTDPGIGDGVVDDCVGRLATVTGGVPPPGLPGIEQLEGPDGLADLYTLNPAWGEVFLVGNFNTAEYEAVVVELTRRQYRNWQMNASYTWSKAVGNAEDFNQILGDDPTLVDDEYGFLAYDQRHVFKVNATTIVPWAGGFRFGTAVQWQSGLPYSAVTRKPVVDALPHYIGTVGTEPHVRLRYEGGQRNDLRNESWWNLDLHLAKEFRVYGKTEFQLSLDVFNLLNDNALQVVESLDGQNSAIRRFGRQFQIGFRAAF